MCVCNVPMCNVCAMYVMCNLRILQLGCCVCCEYGALQVPHRCPFRTDRSSSHASRVPNKGRPKHFLGVPKAAARADKARYTEHLSDAQLRREIPNQQQGGRSPRAAAARATTP